MQLAETFEPEQQVAEFVLPAKHTFNGGEPFLEDRRVEKWLASAFGRLPVSGIRVDVRYHAAIENRLAVTRAIVNAIQAHDRAAKLQADGTRDPRPGNASGRSGDSGGLGFRGSDLRSLFMDDDGDPPVSLTSFGIV